MSNKTAPPDSRGIILKVQETLQSARENKKTSANLFSTTRLNLIIRLSQLRQYIQPHFGAFKHWICFYESRISLRSQSVFSIQDVFKTLRGFQSNGPEKAFLGSMQFPTAEVQHDSKVKGWHSFLKKKKKIRGHRL